MLASRTRPLLPCTRADFNQLLVCLWSFVLCTAGYEDHVAGNCEDPDCSFQRIVELDAFFGFYKHVCSSYRSLSVDGSEPALSSHADLVELIKIIRDHPDLSREELINDCLSNHPAGGPLVPVKDRDQAIDLAVRIMTMINVQQQDPSFGTIHFGGLPQKWSDEMSFSHFIEVALPRAPRRLLIVDPGITSTQTVIKAELTAQRVLKQARLKFKPTDDLSRHLKIDQKLRVVEIFHHVAFLKEHLRLTRGQDLYATTSDQIKIGAIPRQVALEVLDSIQKILFRHSSAPSRAILRSLVSNDGFDPECLYFEASALRLPDEEELSYHYFGSRMAELYAEIEHPAPDGIIEEWMERRSHARHFMLATLIGVASAVLLGFLSLMASIYQAYISYQAWHHPV